MAATKKTTKKAEVQPKHIGLVQNDSWLEPFEEAIRGRHDHAVWKLNQLTRNGKKSLKDFAAGHLYFGLHQKKILKWTVFEKNLVKRPVNSIFIWNNDTNGCIDQEKK